MCMNLYIYIFILKFCKVIQYIVFLYKKKKIRETEKLREIRDLAQLLYAHYVIVSAA